MALSTGDKEKQQLSAILKDRLIAGRNTITYRELLDEEMPLFFKNFLQNRVKKLFVTNEPIQFKNVKKYDFNNPRIQQLKAELRSAFEEATIFTKEEISEIIQRTVNLQFDLLVRPKETLTTIFYKSKSERMQSEILQILSNLTDKRLYIQQLIANIREFDQYHILRDDFEKLAAQTQQQLFSENFLPAFMSDILTYTEFVGHIKGDEISHIHKEIVQLFLSERSYDHLCSSLEGVRENDLFDVNELGDLLSKFMDSNGKDVTTEYEDIDDDLEEFIVSAVETEPIFPEPQEQAMEQTQVDDEKEIEQVPTIPPDETVPEADMNLEKHFPVIEQWKDPQDIVIDRRKIESQPKGPLLSLQAIIDEKNKRLIQKKIFDKDELAYNNFIMRLEDIDNWKEAKQVIDEELLLRSIQPFSKEALALGDLVFNRYFPKKK